MQYIVISMAAPVYNGSLPPRCSRYDPVVKVMTHDYHAEGSLILFDVGFKDYIDAPGPNGGPVKRYRLDPKCLVARELEPENPANLRREFRQSNNHDDTVAVAFAIDDTPGDNGSLSGPQCIGVQTHGFINLMSNQLIQPNNPINLQSLVPSSNNPKATGYAGNQTVGYVTKTLPRMDGDDPGHYRVRVKLIGATFNY